MTPAALIETAVLLGLLVLAGGGYAGLYGYGRLRARPALVAAATACWIAALAIALAIAVVTPLETGWKWLVVVSAIVYAVIPPATWRYLERLHVAEGEGP